MKKSQIIKLITFPILLVGCLFSLEFFLFRNASDDHTAYGEFYKEEDNCLDVVLIGNSTLREGYVPTTMWKEEGIMSRGLSSSPTHPEVIVNAIGEVVKKQHPSVVFIDVNGLTFQYKEDAESRLREYYNALPEGEHKKQLREKYPEWFDEDDNKFEIFPHHNNLRQQIYWESLVYPDQFKTKGYQPNKIVKSVEPIAIDEEKLLPLTTDGENYFNEIVAPLPFVL